MAPGIWGKPSSTIDFCEENYAVTPYIAEFWNTISNLAFIITPSVSTYLLVKQKFEKKFIAGQLSLLGVGIGSSCFHMTLLYSMQLLDELPMIWGTALVLYIFLEVKSPPNHRNVLLISVLLTFCVVVTVIYAIWKVYSFFIVSYGALTILVTIVATHTVRNTEGCSMVLFKMGLSSYVFAFLLWMLDNNICGSLRVLRDFLGFVSPVLELHAWWHIFACFGTYIAIIFVTHTRCLVIKRDVRILYWLSFWPYLQVEYTPPGKYQC